MLDDIDATQVSEEDDDDENSVDKDEEEEEEEEEEECPSAMKTPSTPDQNDHPPAMMSRKASISHEILPTPVCEEMQRHRRPSFQQVERCRSMAFHWSNKPAYLLSSSPDAATTTTASSIAAAAMSNTPPTPPTTSKRTNVINEILATERNYVKSLETLEHYFKCSKYEASLRSYFGPVHFSQMDVESILTVNTEFLRRLEGGSSIARAFLEFAPYLKLYSAFINKYDVIQSVLNSCKEEAWFSEVSSLFIQPVQRLPRYVLLLDSLIKYTDEQDEEKRLLEESLRLVKDVADKVNEQKRESENMALVSTVCGRIMGMPKILNVLGPARRYIGEGYLGVQHMMTVGDEGAKMVYCFVFNDLMVLCMPSKGGSSSGNSSVNNSSCGNIGVHLGEAYAFVETIEFASKHVPVMSEVSVDGEDNGGLKQFVLVVASCCGRSRWKFTIPMKKGKKGKMIIDKWDSYEEAVGFLQVLKDTIRSMCLSLMMTTSGGSGNGNGSNNSSSSSKLLMRRTSKQGWFWMRRSRKNGGDGDYGRRWGVLVNGCLCYYNESCGEVDVAGVLPMCQCVVRKMMLKGKNLIEISHPHRRTYQLSFTSDFDLDCWVASLALSVEISEEVSSFGQHEFVMRSFVAPVDCVHCGLHCWGNMAGYICKGCRVVCHRQCLDVQSSTCKLVDPSDRKGTISKFDAHPQVMMSAIKLSSHFSEEISQTVNLTSISNEISDLCADPEKGGTFTLAMLNLRILEKMLTIWDKWIEFSSLSERKKEESDATLRERCIFALNALKSLGNNIETKFAVVGSKDACVMMVSLLAVGNDVEIKQTVAGLIWTLAYHSGPSRINDALLVVGIVPALVSTVKTSTDEDLAIQCVGSLATLCFGCDGVKLAVLETDVLNVIASALPNASATYQIQGITLFGNLSNCPVSGLSPYLTKFNQAMKIVTKTTKDTSVLKVAKIVQSNLKQ